MFNFYIYGALGLIILSLAGGFYLYYQSSEADKRALIQENAIQAISLETQKHTIDNMKKTAETIIKANSVLSNDLMEAESKAAEAKRKIDDEDYRDLKAEEIERKINEEYISNNRNLGSR